MLNFPTRALQSGSLAYRCSHTRSVSSNLTRSLSIGIIHRNPCTSFNHINRFSMAPKRKRGAEVTPVPASTTSIPILPPDNLKSIPVGSDVTGRHQATVDTNPDHNGEILDSKTALRASPDAEEPGEAFQINRAISTPAKKSAMKSAKKEGNESDLSDGTELEPTPAKKPRKTPTKSSIAAKKGTNEIKAFKAEQAAKKAAEAGKIKLEDNDDGMGREDPDGDGDAPAEDADAVTREANRPPPVNSEYLPLPWKGRLGYACLNTYLRLSNPPVFSSRTCRIASILEHRHPLQDPSQPEHSTKNRPDKTKPADVVRGQRYVEELGLANAKDIPKMLRWNDKYGIKFMRLSSEMFPFASHEEYGYKLAPFASEALAEAGRVATELGHRLTTHPGQFTQLGSPRVEVIKNALRDLEYHAELLSLLKMPPQEDRDAVMILHLGGTFGDKSATLDRFRENYLKLPQAVKNRLVLENDDVSWSVHDLLPLCEELNIPLVLDFHHHNIIFDASQIREGTHDIRALFPRIKATWDRKQIRQKMHYSEGTPAAVTGRQRRKHNPRPATLPPCPDDMDLMIEAKDKEQAVFELMRTLKLPGFETFNDIVPYERNDDNKPAAKKAKKKKTKKQIAAEVEEFGKELSEAEDPMLVEVPEAEVGMGGPQNRVYWPPGMEEWLRPKKREIKKKDGAVADDLSVPTPHNFAARMLKSRQEKAMIDDSTKKRIADAGSVAEVQAILDEIRASVAAPGDEKSAGGAVAPDESKTPIKKVKTSPAKKQTPAKKATPVKRKNAKTVPTPSVSDDEDDEDASMTELCDGEEVSGAPAPKPKVAPVRLSRRASSKKANYAVDLEGVSE